MMYRSDGMVWSRDEYLTEVQESVFVELPEANMFSEDHDELGK